MKRYETETWKKLERAQNANPEIDILTITAFMDDEELERHAANYIEGELST